MRKNIKLALEDSQERIGRLFWHSCQNDDANMAYARFTAVSIGVSTKLRLHWPIINRNKVKSLYIHTWMSRAH